MKTFYVVVVKSPSSFGGNWSKGLSLKKCMALSKVKLSSNFVVYQAIIKDTATNEQIENLCSCFDVNNFGYVSLYTNPSQSDMDMVNEYLLGWITNVDFLN